MLRFKRRLRQRIVLRINMRRSKIIRGYAIFFHGRDIERVMLSVTGLQCVIVHGVVQPRR